MANIIFIQGILHPESNSKQFIAELTKQGHQVTFFPLFYFITETKKHHSLIEKVNHFLDTSDQEFIIVGHSFGGILAHCLRLDLYHKISKIITIASPHAGKNPVVLHAISKLPYHQDLGTQRITLGYFLDVVVPFWDTRHPQTDKHILRIGGHTSALFLKHETNFLVELIIEEL